VEEVSVYSVCSSADKYKHLMDYLDLADSFSEAAQYSRRSRRLSILVGADQYHRFVTGETKRNEEYPVATKSAFGWVVSGPIDEQRVSDSNSFH